MRRACHWRPGHAASRGGRARASAPAGRVPCRSDGAAPATTSVIAERRFATPEPLQSSRLVLSESYKVLVAEPLAESGVALLRQRFAVDVVPGLSAEELAERIGVYDGIVIRSATRLTEEVLARAGRLKVIGRAGIGVDNVDVAAATKRGIVVANAPQSNVE